MNSEVDFKHLKRAMESFNKQKLSQEGFLQVVLFGKEFDSEKKEKIQKRFSALKPVFCNSEQEALEAINGKYVNFSNGVDIWNDGALDLICKNLEKNKKNKCATGRIQMLKKKDAKRKESDNIIFNIENEPQSVVDNLKIMIFDSSLLKRVIKLSHVQDEDSSLIALSVMLQAKEYIYIPDAIIWNEECSAWQYDDKNNFITECGKESENICGSITEYAYQFMLAAVFKAIVNGGDKKETIECLQKIPDDTIASYNLYSRGGRLWEKKRYAYQLKHGIDSLKSKGLDKEGKVFFGESMAFYVKENSLFQVVILSVDSKNKEMILEGFDHTNYIDSKAQSFVQDEKGNKYPLEVADFVHDDLLGCDGEIIRKGRRFKVTVPLHFGMRLDFVIRYSETGQEFTCKFSRGRFLRLHPHLTHTYYEKKPYIVQLEENTITIEKSSSIKHLTKEIIYLSELVVNGQAAQACYRLAYWFSRIFKSNKPIWIVNDRPHNAGDNGEALFTYLMKSPVAKTHKIYFMLSEKSPDYERLSKVGPVLKYYSRQHKLKFLQADKIISSIGNDLPINPFGKSRKYYNDLYKADFIYLRHGVAKDDQSRWLNKFNKNYRLINSSAKREHEAVSSGNYLYSKDQTVLCGLPRFDNLKSDNKNKIVILPTWRRNLQGMKNEYSELRSYNASFAESDYCKFYNNLINDEKLLKVMREKGFTGDFYLHPVMSSQAKDFKGNDVIKVHNKIANYQKEFAESNIMITDFSSVAFDFAYLKKPVIYSQFDKDSFYDTHSWDRGYFTYEDDGFGMITQDVETTRDAIINYIMNGCEMEQKYKDRVDKFFAYTDRNNCKRMTEAILKTENE